MGLNPLSIINKPIEQKKNQKNRKSDFGTQKNVVRKQNIQMLDNQVTGNLSFIKSSSDHTCSSATPQLPSFLRPHNLNLVLFLTHLHLHHQPQQKHNHKVLPFIIINFSYPFVCYFLILQLLSNFYSSWFCCLCGISVLVDLMCFCMQFIYFVDWYQILFIIMIMIKIGFIGKFERLYFFQLVLEI